MYSKDETQSLAAIGARIIEIEAELFAPGGYTHSNITSPDGAQLDGAKARRFELLGRERTELLAKLPPIGMASGERVIFARMLGDLRDWPPMVESEADDGYDPSDPYERFERECGIRREK
jgi:hypothetical protein